MAAGVVTGDLTSRRRAAWVNASGSAGRPARNFYDSFVFLRQIVFNQTEILVATMLRSLQAGRARRIIAIHFQV
jgi:hypothetical protein